MGFDSPRMLQIRNYMNIVENGIYQHKYGGVYRLHYAARDAETKTEMIVYSHIFPFESQIWVRPLTEWTKKFNLITTDEFTEISRKNKLQFQNEILSRKSGS